MDNMQIINREILEEQEDMILAAENVVLLIIKTLDQIEKAFPWDLEEIRVNNSTMELFFNHVEKLEQMYDQLN